MLRQRVLSVIMIIGVFLCTHVKAAEIEGQPSYFPVAIEELDENGEKIIIKTYEIPSNVQPYDLVEGAFERNGYIYEARDILFKKLKDGVESKPISKQVTINTATNNKTAIVSQFATELAYNEAGYAGTLKLDIASITTKSAGSKSYSYTVSDTKQYTGFSRNDPSQIPKTATKNGVTLTLTGVTWAVSGTAMAEDANYAAQYTATAHYSGQGTGSKTTGYVSTATYHGTVQRTTDSGAVCSIIYAGTAIPLPAPQIPIWCIYVLVLLLAVALMLLLGVLIKKGKRQRCMLASHEVTPMPTKQEPFIQPADQQETMPQATQTQYKKRRFNILKKRNNVKKSEKPEKPDKKLITLYVPRTDFKKEGDNPDEI